MMQMIGMTLMEMNKHSIVDGIEKMLKVDWLMLMKEMLMQDGIMTKNSIYIYGTSTDIRSAKDRFTTDSNIRKTKELVLPYSNEWL